MQTNDTTAAKPATTTIIVPPAATPLTETKTSAGTQAGGAVEKKAEKKAEKESGTPAAGGDPAFKISQSMEKLLDGLTGKSGMQDNPEVMRAKQAERMMRGIQQMSRAVTEMTTRALDMLKGDLGKTLGGFGMKADAINDILGGYGKHLQDKMKGMDFNKVSLDISQSNMQMSLESRGIDLTITDGDRKISVSFAKSTLEFARDDQRLQASMGKDGSFGFAFGQSSTTANAKSTDMIVKAEGFSQEEIQGVLEKLNGMMDKGALSGMNGTAVIRPEKGAGGALKLKLDLSVVLGAETAGASPSKAMPEPAAGAAGKLNVVA